MKGLIFQFGRLFGGRSPLRGWFAKGFKGLQGLRSRNGQPGQQKNYSEDFFADTRMSFGEHIEVLRTHLLRAIYGFMLVTCVGLWYGDWLVKLIAQPIEDQLQRTYDERVAKVQKNLEENNALEVAANKAAPITMRLDNEELRKALDLPLPAEKRVIELKVQIPPLELVLQQTKAQTLLKRPQSLKTFTAMEGFLVYLKVSMFFGVVFGSPWIFYQLWAFVAAGLYPHERKYVTKYLPISLLLFLTGVLLCEWIVLPAALHYLLGFNEWLNVEPELRLNDWLTFAILTPLIFGVSFQLPLLMLFMERIGVMDVTAYRQYRRIAYFVMCLVTILLAPSPDPYSFTPLMLSLWGLYELGILLCRFLPKPEEPPSEEMVEV